MSRMERRNIAIMEQYLTPQQNTSFDRRRWAIFIFLLAVFSVVQYVPLSTIEFEDLSSGVTADEQLSSSEALPLSIKEGDPKRQVALGLFGLFGFVSLFGKHLLHCGLMGFWVGLSYFIWLGFS